MSLWECEFCFLNPYCIQSPFPQIHYKIFFSGCECNLDGSVDNVCALEDGKCTCKDNIDGHNCDKSAECWWNFPNPEGIINSSKSKYNT